MLEAAHFVATTKRMLKMTIDTETDLTDRRAKLIKLIQLSRNQIKMASDNQHDTLAIRKARKELFRAEEELTQIDAELYPKE